MNIEKAKQIPIEFVLQKLNHLPSKISGNDFWYLSPFREEKTSSFKVNTKINKWYDHGIQKGGNLVDLIIEMYHFSISEALHFLEDFDKEASIFSFQKQKDLVKNDGKKDTTIKINKVIDIHHFALKEYLENRKIYLYEDEPNLKEVHFQINNKKYFGIGFKNNTEGFEIRSKYSKICIGKKDVTLLVKGYKNKLRIFEGFFDYLSFKNAFELDSDFLILNSITLINRCDEILSNYDEIELFFDNDEAGNQQTILTMERFRKSKDCRIFYKDFKDLNDWLLNTNF